MPKVIRARKRTLSTVKPVQLSLLDLIAERRLGAEQTEALRGLLAAKTPSTTWRGLTIMPPGSLLDRAVSLFERTTDFPLELPAFMVLHIMAAYLLDRGVEIEVAGTRLKPDLWSTLLAPSGAGKTKTASVLARVMPVRLFPETTTSARFIEELAAHNRGLWLQDEWGQFLRRIETQSYAEEMREYLLRAHDGKPLARRTAKGSIEVEEPALVILGTTVFETFTTIVSAESMLDGFMQRFGIVIGEADPARPPHRFPIYRVEEAGNLAPLQAAWETIAALPLHSLYTVTPEAEAEFEAGFRHHFEQHHAIPASFFRRVMWRVFKYAAIYHVLLGKDDARIDAEDVGWAMRVAVLHLTDARRLLDGYNLSKLEAVIVKAEVFQAKIGHRPSKRELISGVRDIQNNVMAEFVLEVMTPLPGANDNTGLADDKAAA
ncbi:hypothetical protein CCC_00220 [Paramagnetospirillum magnetotacticum MS-1]|uniref:DUF3987 domain-containing protein n=1 Tax=Paramagnetospirillum magnetotacticum MS-1 TaxID=272627 RepID=A0A0C2YBQ9_PARME|nr:DUF3987 domain-containing protein [Paramagnetospirillum magnetotacticum]KIL97159.1 hypothetical protein CCC_00220 [Paramagnetospirillum magnetotacticum MS-1]